MEDLHDRSRDRIYFPDHPFPRFFRRDGKTVVVPFGHEDCTLRLRTPAVMEFAEKDLTDFSALANLFHLGITRRATVFEWFPYVEKLICDPDPERLVSIDRLVNDDSDEGRFLIYVNCRLYWFYLGEWFAHGQHFQKRIDLAGHTAKWAKNMPVLVSAPNIREGVTQIEKHYQNRRDAIVKAQESLSLVLGKTRYRPAQFSAMQKRIFENIGAIAAGYSCKPRTIRDFLDNFVDALPIEKNWRTSNLTPPKDTIARAAGRRQDYDSAVTCTIETARTVIAHCQELRPALSRFGAALSRFLPTKTA